MNRAGIAYHTLYQYLSLCVLEEVRELAARIKAGNQGKWRSKVGDETDPSRVAVSEVWTAVDGSNGGRGKERGRERLLMRTIARADTH